jgi:hypothetical protein
MALDISDAFIKQFESEVHVAFQRMGSKLRGTVRTKTNITGDSVRFQKFSKGTAGQKNRHGNVPLMSVDHSYVEATLSDYYAADFVDRLDELKINIEERQLLAQAGAAALGRKTDDIILTAMDGATLTLTEGGTVGLATAASRSKIETVFRTFGDNDVPDDGRRYWQIGPTQWIDLLQQTAFASADYVGDSDLPFKGGAVAKNWMSFTFLQHSGLPKTGNIRKTFAYHSLAVGHAIGADVRTEINYVPEKVSNLITSYMSMGSVLIDPTAIYEVQAYEA